MVFEGNDRVEEIATGAASAFADECFRQNGMDSEHDDEWYGIQESLRNAILEVVYDKITECV